MYSKENYGTIIAVAMNGGGRVQTGDGENEVICINVCHRHDDADQYLRINSKVFKSLGNDEPLDIMALLEENDCVDNCRFSFYNVPYEHDECLFPYYGFDFADGTFVFCKLRGFNWGLTFGSDRPTKSELREFIVYDFLATYNFDALYPREGYPNDWTVDTIKKDLIKRDPTGEMMDMYSEEDWKKLSYDRDNCEGYLPTPTKVEIRRAKIEGNLPFTTNSIKFKDGNGDISDIDWIDDGCRRGLKVIVTALGIDFEIVAFSYPVD